MFGDKKLHHLGQRAITKMATYHWPGNVRELQNVLKRIMILGDGEETIDDLLNTSARQQPGSEFQTAGTKPLIPVDLWRLNGDRAPNLSSLSLKKVRKKALDRVEREVITYVLEKTGWNRSKAAKILNISYKALLYKIKELDIKRQ
jgi:DNA-binding NtrC family response regulator